MQDYKQNVLLKLSYDGTHFLGWQAQKKNGVLLGRTVQEALEDALEKLHHYRIKTVAAGRTDTGVHAREQAVNFFTNLKSINELQFPLAINAFLPHTIRVLSAHFVVPSFSARFNALFRTYRYFIFCGKTPYPYNAPYCFHIRHTPSIAKLNELTCVLLGEKDFSFFAYSRDPSVSKARYIKKAHFFIEGNYLVFEITASSFLWRMVRSIVGTLLDYERKGLDASYLQNVMLSKERKYAGVTAPPNALFLWNVEYPKDIFMERIESR